MEEKNETTCIGCVRKEFELRDKDKDLVAAKAENERERQARQVAETTVTSLQAKVAEFSVPKETPPPELPNVREFVNHCESGNCEHAREWKEVKRELIQDAISKLTPDIVKAKAMEMNLIPENINIKNIESLLGK